MEIDLRDYSIVGDKEKIEPGDLFKIANGNFQAVHHRWFGCLQMHSWRSRIYRKNKVVIDDSVAITIRVSRSTATKFAETDSTTYTSKYLRSIASECKAVLEAEELEVKVASDKVDRLHRAKEYAKDRWTEIAKKTKTARRELQELRSKR